MVTNCDQNFVLSVYINSHDSSVGAENSTKQSF